MDKTRGVSTGKNSRVSFTTIFLAGGGAGKSIDCEEVFF